MFLFYKNNVSFLESKVFVPFFVATVFIMEMNKYNHVSFHMKIYSHMKKYCKLLCAFPIVAVMLTHSSCKADHSIKVNNSTVNQVDIHRYMGKWYEIARYDHSFERGMSNVTAEYSIQGDGEILVVNKGVKNGKLKEIVGKGKQPNPNEYPGRLKVSFFLWFYGDYNILELDKDYQYALVGSSSDKYLWILSRTPEMTDVQLDYLLKKIIQRGYDPSKLIYK